MDFRVACHRQDNSRIEETLVYLRVEGENAQHLPLPREFEIPADAAYLRVDVVCNGEYSDTLVFPMPTDPAERAEWIRSRTK